MNEDYLWDKTGGDPEIERLENVLAAFRYAETDAPAVEAKVLTLEPRPARFQFFRFKYAAASLAFAALVFAVSLQFSSDETNVENESAQALKSKQIAATEPNNANQIESNITNRNDSSGEKTNDSNGEKSSVPANEKSNDSTAKNSKNLLRLSERKIVKIKAEIAANNRRSDAKPPITKRAGASAKLTDEERFAYKQLMLALSVTSSKLQIVKDKVQSADEKPLVKITTKDGR